MINFSYLHRKWKISQQGICDFLAQRVATCLDKMTVASHIQAVSKMSLLMHVYESIMTHSVRRVD
jgi:hypothetical protein